MLSLHRTGNIRQLRVYPVVHRLRVCSKMPRCDDINGGSEVVSRVWIDLLFGVEG